MSTSMEARAKAIARIAHHGQVDKSGAPYIEHVLAVADQLEGYERVVGLLHDVLEDTIWTSRDLRDLGISQPVIYACEALVKRRGEETYDEYIERLVTLPGRSGKWARAVKVADLRDNLGLVRPRDPAQVEKRRKKYEAAVERLTPREGS